MEFMLHAPIGKCLGFLERESSAGWGILCVINSLANKCLLFPRDKRETLDLWVSWAHLEGLVLLASQAPLDLQDQVSRDQVI